MMGDSRVIEFENIIYEGASLGEKVGKLRLAARGVGWKAFKTEEIYTIQASDIKKTAWLRVAKEYSLRFTLAKNSLLVKFEGFKREEFDTLKDIIRQHYHLTLEPKELSLKGWNWGKLDIQPSHLGFSVSNKTLLELPYKEIANTNAVAKNEFNVEFTQHMGDGKRSKEDSLVEIRFYTPGMAPKVDGDDGEAGEDQIDEQQTAAEYYYETIKEKADLSVERSDNIVSFHELPFLTPRGRYEVDMYSNFLRLRGKTYDYINFSSIQRLFLLPKPDDKHVLFIVNLDPPLRQGQTRYPFLVLQFLRDEEIDVELNLDEEIIKEKYEGKLQKSYDAPTFEVVSSIFRGLAQKKITVPGNFRSRVGSHAIKCSMKANEGYLYPLEKSLIFIPKPTQFMLHTDITMVELSPHERYVTSKFILKSSPDQIFSSISREELENFVQYLQDKKIRVKNQVRDGVLSDASPQKRVKLAGDEEESPDEDFIATSDNDEDIEEEFNSDYDSDSGESPSSDQGDE